MIGSIILDLVGTELNAEERELLQHPLVGGVILFTRNYESPEQVSALCQHIRKSRATPLLITVDHEGGRVQRFKNGLTELPRMGMLGKYYESFPAAALQLTEICGWLMAAELLSVGIDLSFAPVLDLNKTTNPAIGDRAFHAKADTVINLAQAIIRGMRSVGMAATGKHFPGHGSVSVDSHLAMPVDERHLEQIMAEDMQPFAAMIQSTLPAVMAAHILFPKIDDQPVGFSKRWLQEILRQQLKFSGVIFSDDLNMEGASSIGDHSERARIALNAGCDMVLICNNRPAAIRMLDQLPKKYFIENQKFKMLQGKFSFNYSELKASHLWREKHEFYFRNKDHYEAH